MRQVPKNKVYCIIGSGRLAKHLRYYFHLKKIPHLKWSRDLNPNHNSFLKIADNQRRLEFTLEQSDIALLAISDNSIEGFAQNYIADTTPTIHFSGAMTSPDIYGAHPLMTFSDKLYDLATYESIPFVLDFDSKHFSNLFDRLTNPYWEIKPQLKPLYHSLCVTSGNFSQILWKEVFEQFQSKLQLPPQLLLPYLQQTFKNISELKNFETGPLIRRDTKSIKMNLAALDQNKLQKIYQDFVELKGIEI